MVLLSLRREEQGKVGLRYGPTNSSPTLLYEDLVEPYLNPTLHILLQEDLVGPYLNTTLHYSSLRRVSRTIS